MARRICKPARPVRASTCACSSAHASAIGNGTHQLLISDDLELLIGLALFALVILFHGGSPSKKGFATELYPSSGESHCFLFSSFN